MHYESLPASINKPILPNSGFGVHTVITKLKVSYIENHATNAVAYYHCCHSTTKHRDHRYLKIVLCPVSKVGWHVIWNVPP